MWLVVMRDLFGQREGPRAEEQLEALLILEQFDESYVGIELLDVTARCSRVPSTSIQL